MGEPVPMEGPRFNWWVKIVCKDCGAAFRVLRPDPSIGLLEPAGGGPSGRAAMIYVPNVCPQCRNIRLVEADRGPPSEGGGS